MKTTLILALTCSAASPLVAQGLTETFDYSSTSVFPPAGWSLVDHAMLGGPGWEEPATMASSLDWQFLIVDAAGHDDYLNAVSNDASLVSPSMDLSSFSSPQLVFDEDVEWVSYMLHHPGSLGMAFRRLNCRPTAA